MTWAACGDVVSKQGVSAAGSTGMKGTGGRGLTGSWRSPRLTFPFLRLFLSSGEPCFFKRRHYK